MPAATRGSTGWPARACSSNARSTFGNLAGIAPYASINGLAQAVGVPGIDLLGQGWQETMDNRSRNKALAFYGDAIWHLGPSTNLTTGVRFTRDEKRFSWFSPLRSAPGT